MSLPFQTWAQPQELHCLLQDQLLMRSLQPGESQRSPLATVGRLHRRQNCWDKTSLFPKTGPVSWSRLWLPGGKGPEHPQARGANHLSGKRKPRPGLPPRPPTICPRRQGVSLLTVAQGQESHACSLTCLGPRLRHWLEALNTEGVPGQRGGGQEGSVLPRRSM